MTTDNQALLSAIRQIVSESLSEAIVPLTGRIDALTERVDALTERVDALTERSQRMEAEQRDQRVMLSSLSTRLDSVVAYVMRLDSRVETIESRMGEIAADIFDMQERLRMVEDRVREGFHALKSDFQVAFSDIRAIRKTQNRQDTAIAALHDERAGIQQRLSALEGRQT
jgi:chromosome segregation ATPase